MTSEILGIHHVTAIAGDPQRNLDFYTGILGLRLVKLTVNYDDPDTYHFYYGDALGRPGTVLTFFPWPGAHKGRKGTGQATSVSFSIPSGSPGFWMEHLAERGIETVGPIERFGEELLTFSDPDGLKIELVSGAGKATDTAPKAGPVPPEHAIRGFHGVTLSEEGYERTASLLSEGMEFRFVGSSGNRFRHEVGPGGHGALLDVLCLPSSPGGQVSVGTVHHVAWRTPDDRAQRAWRRTIAGLGYNVTPVLDRNYFDRSISGSRGSLRDATDSPASPWTASGDRLGKPGAPARWSRSVTGSRLLLRLPKAA
jgi:catechol 2,3-dioxygenase-like lactoylglutathione lyase family enzyme